MNLRGDIAPRGQGAGPDLDYGFLARQCMGDAALEREILGLFLREARRLGGEIARPGQTVAEIADKAHKLKGSALAVGAGPLAEDAAQLEALCRCGGAASERQMALARLQAAVGRVCSTIAPPEPVV
jgi:HPt (histidine-containing phosphotransfer) domain-containing protein